MSELTPIMDMGTDPKLAKAVRDFITLFRLALAPIMNADLENLPQHQSTALTAGGMFAGMTAGHMLGVGVLKGGDSDSAKLVAMQAFDSGLIIGLREAQLAMIAAGKGGRS